MTKTSLWQALHRTFIYTYGYSNEYAFTVYRVSMLVYAYVCARVHVCTCVCVVVCVLTFTKSQIITNYVYDYTLLVVSQNLL